MPTIQAFINSQKITMSADRADANPNMADDEWSWTATHYKCRFTRQRRRMTVYFSMGSAHTKEPTAAEVLSCIASDAAGYINARGFEDWCADYGYDSDSRKAERIYEACNRQAKQLRRFLPEASYEVLLFHTEQL